jgi:hypothetical protein
MKINDVVTLMEFGFGPPGSRAMGTGNFALLHRAYVNKRPRLSRNLQLDFGNNQMIELDDDDIEAVANYYDALPADQDRYEFVYNVMSRGDKFAALLQKLGRRTGTPQQPNLLERDVNKNSDPDLSRGGVRSAALNTALRQAYAKYPQAQSDMEALLMYDMEVQKNTGQELKSQDQTNQRQDDVDAQLRDVNRKQSNKIGNLDDENDALSAELDKLSQELDAMAAQPGSAPERRKDSDSAKTPDSDTGSSNYGVNVRSDARADKSQKRSADAEKRKSEPAPEPSPEPATLKPGSNTFKPLGSTLATVPTVKPPAPTIDVIDRPDPSSAMSQMAQQLTTPTEPSQDMELPTRLGADPDEPAADTTQPDLFAEPEDNIKVDQPLPQSMSSMDAEPESPLPPNVTNLATRRNRMAEPGSDQYRRDTVAKAGELMRNRLAMHEAQELRRMRELAGLTR